jgi:hypothetical protein
VRQTSVLPLGEGERKNKCVGPEGVPKSEFHFESLLGGRRRVEAGAVGVWKGRNFWCWSIIKRIDKESLSGRDWVEMRISGPLRSA